MTSRLVAYGHSWVAGDGATKPERVLVDVAAGQLGLEPENLGVGGSHSVQTAELVRKMGVPDATLYLLMTGLNDARFHGADRTALERYANAVRIVVGRCLDAAQDAVVLVVEQPPLVDYTRHAPHDKGSTAAVELYNTRQRQVLAGLERVAEVHIDAWNPYTMLDEDTVHPNDRGHAAIGMAIAAAYRSATMGSTRPVHD
jgi:lysophospholipase L1-like esterase